MKMPDTPSPRQVVKRGKGRGKRNKTQKFPLGRMGQSDTSDVLVYATKPFSSLCHSIVSVNCLCAHLTDMKAGGMFK